MDKKDILNHLLSYIEDNLEKELTLDVIANEVCYSKFYIARIFKEYTGRTLHKYIQNRRLTKAAWQLAETDKPVIEIAYEAHYASQQAFTKAFQQEYDCPPQVYRKNKLFYPRQPEITLKSQYTGGKLAA